LVGQLLKNLESVGWEWPCVEKQMHNPPLTFHPHDNVTVVNGLSVYWSVLIAGTVNILKESDENMKTRLYQNYLEMLVDLSFSSYIMVLMA
jgi:hypothetical protein